MHVFHHIPSHFFCYPHYLSCTFASRTFCLKTKKMHSAHSISLLMFITPKEQIVLGSKIYWCNFFFCYWVVCFKDNGTLNAHQFHVTHVSQVSRSTKLTNIVIASESNCTAYVQINGPLRQCSQFIAVVFMKASQTTCAPFQFETSKKRNAFTRWKIHC